MRSFSLVGIFAGLALLAAPCAGQSRKVGMLEIEGTPLARPHDLAWLAGSTVPTLRELVAAVNWSAESDDLDTLLVRLKDAELDRAQIEELGSALRDAREAGKEIVVFAESYGPGDLLLGSHADRVLIQKGGQVSLPGLYMQELFLADALAWVGVKADMVQIGDYKGASEMLVNSQPSKAWDDNINQLLDSMYATMRRDLKQGRKLDDARLDAAMQKAWMADADEAVAMGLVDAAVDLPELGSHLAGGDANDDSKVSWVEVPVGGKGEFKVDSANPFAAFTAMMSMLSSEPSHGPKGPAIAVLHIDGSIVDGESASGGLMGGSSVGSRTIRNALEDILKHDKIKGVVVRVDSPGGSAVASEIMWQGIKRVAAKKPVWVSVGSMAASGGYYVAVAGDRIYVNPSSIVGSIGVVGGKIAMGGLFDKLKVNVVSRGRGPMADLLASPDPWTPEQLALVRERMSRTYELFTSRVSAGRSGIDLAKTAEGRLFTGDKAIEFKMADELGGLEDAIEDLAESLKLEDYEVVDYPGPKSLAQIVEDLLGGFAAAPSGASSEFATILRTAVGPNAWPAVSSSIEGVLQFRNQPVQLIMPRALIIK
jgi:protease-4